MEQENAARCEERPADRVAPGWMQLAALFREEAAARQSGESFVPLALFVVVWALCIIFRRER